MSNIDVVSRMYTFLWNMKKQAKTTDEEWIPQRVCWARLGEGISAVDAIDAIEELMFWGVVVMREYSKEANGTVEVHYRAVK